jgi:hypothetical protein
MIESSEQVWDVAAREVRADLYEVVFKYGGGGETKVTDLPSADLAKIITWYGEDGPKKFTVVAPDGSITVIARGHVAQILATPRKVSE